MRLIIPLVAVGFLSACRSSVVKTSPSPCAGVDRGLSYARKSVLAPALAKQLHVSAVDVLQSFTASGWSIIYVDTHESDEFFLFFSGDPVTSPSVTGWGGAASDGEEKEIKDWTLKNAPGIPERLARCFAWHVTRDRDR